MTNTPSRQLLDASSSRHDAIVIGAGLSGLTAAAFLAQAGARVLVCEQAGQIGGLFNSFRRGGYLFDGGIKAVENSAVMMPMLAQLGLLERVQLRRSPIALVTAGEVQPILGFADVEVYFRSLEALYPGEETGLRRVLADARAVYELLDAALCFPIPFFAPVGSFPEAQKTWFQRNGAALTRLPRAAALMRAELRPYLRQHLRSPGLVNLLSQLFPDGTSVFFGLGYFRMFLDYYYPRGGIQAIPAALADAVTGWGGEIRVNAHVEEVLLQGREACGVRLATGEELASGYVIAASDLRQALTRLIPPDTVPPRFERKLTRAEVSHSVFNLFLGVDLPVERLNLAGCQHIFYAPDLEGISEADRVARADYFAHVPQEISIPCLHQPDLAPPGKTGLVVSAMTSWQFDGGWEREPSAYAALKERCTRELIASLERFIPGLAQHIELCFTATPHTVASLTANTQGAIMGWSYHRGRSLPRGNFLQMRSSVLTPVPRLLTAGHWSFSPGGSPVAVLTGKVAAEHVLKHGTDR
ncbi:MAG: NAD(P)/FAD-dependent oxidoreductase [Chloroflexi bacterium]|nr:NAD(P)/FAD-dependent oxidoreductase [Chloroflexota bacterium]